MKETISVVARKCRKAVSRTSPTILVFTKVPATHFLAHETRLAGTVGLNQVVKWTITTVAGLGTYDSVAGATVLTQLAPNPGSSTVDGKTGAQLNFVYQVTGAPSTAKSWRVDGTLPAGMVHQNATRSNVDSITGIPTESGTFNITVIAFEDPGHRGGKKSKAFTINIAPGALPPSIVTHPTASRIDAGTAATLSVTASGPSLSYQWYYGAAGNTSNPVANATSASLTTPVLMETTNFWVRVSNSAGAVDSQAAVVTVVDNFASWRTRHFNGTQLADPAISGPGADPDGDGTPNEEEFVYGTDPLARERRIAPLISLNGNQLSITFQASTTGGLGYAGLTRHYALETSRDLTGNSWTPVQGYADIVGNGQSVTFTDPQAPDSDYFRLRVWLTSD